ncbi:MAG: TetR/AcrR family transcriptional regulator [Syntrophomonadaceae bacterium]|nr:TetR/AcrR family transcriptional regulator [Syntrophomonadaceae bacterium]
MSKDAKAHIIEAAKRVVAKNGVHNASIQSIVEEAGISKGALYHYYKNKNALLYDIMDQSLAVSTDIANKAKSGQYTSEELQEILVDGIVERFAKKDDNRIQYYLSQEAMQGNSEIHARFKEKYNGWVDRVEEIMAGVYGLPASKINRAIAASLIAMVDGQVLQILLEADIVSIEEYREFWRLFLEAGLPAFLQYLAEAESK